MHRSAHTDSFARDNLPPQDAWPNIDLSNFDYGAQLNAAVELTDEMVAKGFGDHVALIGNGRRRTYKELTHWTNRLAHALAQQRCDPHISNGVEYDPIVTCASAGAREKLSPITLF